MKERGSIPMAVLIALGLIVFVIMGMALCGDAIFEDEDEENDLGWGPGVELVTGRDECRNQCGNEHPDCYKARAACSDDDFSPSFDKSPVEDSFNPTICLPYAHCGGESDGAA